MPLDHVLEPDVVDAAAAAALPVDDATAAVPEVRLSSLPLFLAGAVGMRGKVPPPAQTPLELIRARPASRAADQFPISVTLWLEQIAAPTHVVNSSDFAIFQRLEE